MVCTNISFVKDNIQGVNINYSFVILCSFGSLDLKSAIWKKWNFIAEIQIWGAKYVIIPFSIEGAIAVHSVIQCH